MILTVTPNPSLDLLFEAGTLAWDDANRLDTPRARPGGQGINLTRAARALGGDSTAIALLGGRVGDELERMIAGEGTPHVRISIARETRTFVGVRETETGRSLLLNPRGPTIDAGEVEPIIAEIEAAITAMQPSWIAACGSIPPGLPVDLYARIGACAWKNGFRFVPDCDGEALRLAAAHAHLLVPNQHEAERLLNRPLGDIAAVSAAARELVSMGPAVAAITLGAAGAVFADQSSTWVAEPPSYGRGSAVGAGDAFLAAVLIGLSDGIDLASLARNAVAAGTAVLNSSGSDLLARSEYDQICEKVKVRQLD